MDPQGGDDRAAIESGASTPQRHWLRRLVNRLEVDRAVFFSIILRAWQALVAPVTMLLIAQWVSTEEQGYYYTFSSLMALQAFFELGLHSVISNLASHEWAALRMGGNGEVEGAPESIARLGAIWRFVSRWYQAVGVLFAAGVGLTGAVLFSRSSNAVNWQIPWYLLVVVNGCVLWTWAQSTFLEGCNQVLTVNRLRLYQGIAGSLVVWLCFGTVGALWGIVASALVRLAGDSWLIGIRYRHFFVGLRRYGLSASINWKVDILPLQWRVALRGIFSYFATGLFVPVLFAYQGAEMAGRMGMTWTALSALEQIAFAWVGTRTPLLAMLVKRGDFRELDRVFRRVVGISWAVLILGSACLCAVIALLQFRGSSVPLGNKIAARLLEWDVTGVFCLGLLASHLLRSLTTYLLVHMRDPLLIPALLACGCMGFGVWYFGQTGGAMAMAMVFAGVLVGYSLPHSFWIWHRCRKVWHRTSD